MSGVLVGWEVVVLLVVWAAVAGGDWWLGTLSEWCVGVFCGLCGYGGWCVV